MESSEVGKKELNKITAYGSKIKGKGGLKAGDCISQVWQKDRESFLKDQRNNGTYQVIFAHQSTRTICEGGLILVFIHIPCAISFPFFLHWTDFPHFPPLLYQS